MPPWNVSCFLYNMILNVISNSTNENVTLPNYGRESVHAIEFLLGGLFLFLSVCMLIYGGFLLGGLLTYYAKRRLQGFSFRP